MEQPLGSKYLLHEALGRGAMGQVFTATIRDSGDPVAVKVLKPELVSDPEAVARFMRERQILVSIRDSNVVQVIDLVAEGETLAIVMELIKGRDLRRYLRGQRTLAPAEAVRLMIQMLKGMAVVHAAGVIHRDIKPENLLLETSSEQPVLKLTDFGVARLSYGASLTKLSSLIGTPDYMAPELAENNSATQAADLYSAGVVLYEMIGGRTPFAGGHPLAILRRHVDQAPPPIPGIPAELWDQIAWLLAKDPAARPASAADAITGLVWQLPTLSPLPALPPMTTPAASPPAGSRTAPPTRNGTVMRHRDCGGQMAANGSSDISGSVTPGDSHPAAFPDESGLLPVPPGHAEPIPTGTVLRPRDRGQSSSPGNQFLARQPESAAGSRLRSRPVAIALAASVAATLAATVILVPSWLSHPATHAAPVASYVFAPQQYPDGLRIVRRWTLGGTNGSILTETITASSGGQALDVPFQEAIPPSIASSLQTVRFSPAPTRIIRADPVVEWELQLPAEGRVTAGYDATVPADGATRARLVRWAQDFLALQVRLPAPHSSRTDEHASAAATPSIQAPATVPAAPIATAPAFSQTPGPPSQSAPRPQAYTSDSLSTSSSSITARVYFGQLRSVISTLSGQVTFNTSASLRAAEPGLCVGTVVFSAVSEQTGAVYAQGLGSGWTAAENAPSPETQDGYLHQQLVVPPSSVSAGNVWQGSAKLVSGNLTVFSGSYDLQLQSQNGSTQTWLVNGQTVTCNS